MIERFLTDVVGVPWDDVHEEAEKLEHAMTPRFEAYVRRVGRRRQHLPARPPDPGRRADRRACRWPTASRRDGHDPAARERGRGPAALPPGRGIEPGLRARVAERRRARAGDRRRTARPRRSPRSVAETVSVARRPLAAAARSRCPSSWCWAASATGARGGPTYRLRARIRPDASRMQRSPARVALHACS